MKIFGRTAFLILFFASFANASEVLLNNEKIDIQSSSATVIRTNQTPETVEISFLVPMENSICERYETRMVLRTSGVECGYDVYTRTISTGRTCIRSNPQGHCQKWADTYRTETVRRPRTCMVPETFCAQYGTATTFEKDSMKIKFKNLPALGDSESEKFTIAAKQKSYGSGNVNYDVKALETIREYKVTQKKFLFWKRDFYIVEEK
jgi:hypothetical protein